MSDAGRSPVVRFGNFVVRRRWWVLIASLAFVVLAIVGARDLAFNTNYRVWFSKQNPELAAFEAIQAIYTKNDSILFVVAPADGRAFTARTMAAVEELTRLAWKIPHSRRVDSVTNFQHTRAKGDDLVVADLIEGAAAKSRAQLDRARAIALHEPQLFRRLISDRAHVTGVNVVLQLPESDLAAVTEAVAHARKLRDSIVAAHPGIEIRMSGLAMLNNAFPEASIHDIETLIPVVFLVQLIFLVLLLRSATGTFSTLVVILMASATAIGAAGWMGMDLTPPSATAPTIIMTLAIADSVHILVTMFRQMRLGMERRAAIVESLRINMQPVFLTSATTIIGFLSMNFSDAPPFRDLGNLTSIGVAAAFFFSILTLPALMAILPLKVRGTRDVHGVLMERLADFVIRQRGRLLWGMAAVILALMAFIPRIELNDEFVKYFDRDIAFRADTDFTTANLTGLYTLEYSLRAASSGGISDPAYLRNLDNFTKWLRAQPEVVHVSALSDTMRRLNRSMHGDDDAWYRLPETRELAAQYLLLFELSLPYGLDLNDQINVDKSATRMVVTVKDISAKEFRAVAARIDRWMAENLPPHMAAAGSGPALMFANISDRNIRAMLSGTALALLLISALLIVALRSLRMGLISLIPNLVPAAMAFGLWGLVVGQVDVAVSVIAAISLGIVVDDTIHFLTKYLRARREDGLSVEEAVRYAFVTVGTALLVTTLVLVAGFMVLFFSSFAINSRMGLLTAIAIAMALAVDFLFLPPLLMKLEERRHVRKKMAPVA